MKKAIMILSVVLTSVTMFGQNIAGEWNGRFNLHGKELKVVFHISKSKTGFTAKMDSPYQKSYGIPVTNTSFNDSILTLVIKNAGIEYLGSIDKYNNFIGTIKMVQSNELFPLILTKEDID